MKFDRSHLNQRNEAFGVVDPDIGFALAMPGNLYAMNMGIHAIRDMPLKKALAIRP